MQTPVPPIPYPLSRSTRLSVMLGLIAIFFIAAPLVLLYAQGFTFDWQRKKIIHGGALSIEAHPAEAKVLLNGIQLASRLPLRVAHVIPGNYHLQIEQEGYTPWERNITVLSNQTLYLHGIDLVKKNTGSSLVLAGRTIETIIPSRENDRFAFLSKEDKTYELFFYEPKTKKTLLLTRVLSENQPRVEWSADNSQILIESRLDGVTHFLVLSPQEPNAIQTLSFNKKERVSFQWKQNGSPGFFFQTGNDIKNIEAQNSVTAFSLSSSTTSWFVDGETLWEFQLNSLSGQGTDGKTLFSASTTYTIDKFLDVNEERAVGQKENAIVIYRFSENTLAEEEIKAKHYKFLKNSGEFLIWNDGELKLIAKNGEVRLINRFNNDILNITTLTDSPTFLVVSQNSLFSFHPYYYTTHELIRAEFIEAVSVDTKRRDIYFLGVQNGERGVWRVGY